MTKGWTNSRPTSGMWIAIRLMAPLANLMGASPVLAQSPPPGYLPPNGPYAAAPVVDFIDPLWVPPRAVMRMLRSAGYEILSPPRVRGVLYSIAVVRPDGEDGRVFMDARDGRLVRFVPGFALNNRTEDDVEFAYNPPSPRLTPPPGPPPIPPPGASSRKTPAGPKTASRTPATTGVAPNSVKLQGAPKVPPAPKPTETTAAPPPQTQAIATKPADAKPADARPPVVLQPTQELPAVLGLE